MKNDHNNFQKIREINLQLEANKIKLMLNELELFGWTSNTNILFIQINEMMK